MPRNLVANFFDYPVSEPNQNQEQEKLQFLATSKWSLAKIIAFNKSR